ncbi:ANR family transcriptional regulator [Aliivibrio fischeri]
MKKEIYHYQYYANMAARAERQGLYGIAKDAWWEASLNTALDTSNKNLRWSIARAEFCDSRFARGEQHG